MFTLRIFEANGAETNLSLGEGYSLYREANNAMAFKNKHHELFNKPIEDKTMSAIIEGHNGLTVPLYYGRQCYVMNDSGKTFANLSFKK